MELLTSLSLSPHRGKPRPTTNVPYFLSSSTQTKRRYNSSYICRVITQNSIKHQCHIGFHYLCGIKHL